MTMTETRARRCSQSPVGRFTIESWTNPGKKYQVVLDVHGRNTCTCMAFVMVKNRAGGNEAIGQPGCTCKHIDALLATRSCRWNSETGEPAQFPTICPRCSSYTEGYSTIDPTKIDLDELMRMFGELKNKAKRRNK